MKKLRLANLKVSSFVTSDIMAKGGGSENKTCDCTEIPGTLCCGTGNINCKEDKIK